MGLEEDLKKLYKERETAKVYITTYKKMLSNIRLAIYTIKKEIRDEKSLEAKKILKKIKKLRTKKKRQKKWKTNDKK